MDTIMHTLTSVADATAVEQVAPLKPALVSIPVACEYLGGISRAKFYADILPFLETVKFGNRNLVVLASLDRLIASRSTTR
jgi:hypothetical protein